MTDEAVEREVEGRLIADLRKALREADERCDDYFTAAASLRERAEKAEARLPQSDLVREGVQAQARYAGRVAQLEAENERLRAALERIDKHADRSIQIIDRILGREAKT